MKILVHIERLNLGGMNFTPAERQRFTASLEAELSRLVTAGGIAHALRNGAALPSVPAAPVSLGGNATAAQAGAEIAGALYSGFGNPEPEGGGQ